VGKAKGKPRAWEVVSCAALVFLLCSSYAPLVLPPRLRRPCGVFTAPLPYLDSAGSSAIQMESHFQGDEFGTELGIVKVEL
jgi:hypothetical protein